jgi:hypothetical protein
MDENTIKAIIESLYKQFFILNAMSESLGSVITLVHKNIQKCSEEECDRASTFSKEESHVCDKHYASNCIDDNGWVESVDADSIRILQDYIDTKVSLLPSSTVH